MVIHNVSPKSISQEVIPTFDMAVNELFFERFPDSILEHQIQVRPYNALKTRNMRSLNPEGNRTVAVITFCQPVTVMQITAGLNVVHR